MKNLHKLIVFGLLFMFSITVNAATQEAGEIDLQNLFLDGAVFGTTVTLAIDALKNILPNFFQGNVLKITSYAMPVVLAFVGWFFDLGFLSEIEEWWMVLITGVYALIVSQFEAYLGIANIILQLLKIDLKGYRAKARKS